MSEASVGPWLRIRFAKLGKVRFTSHRDVARAWERAVRRIGLPVAWSKGFSPRPLLSFGLALPTGAESVAEYLDVRLEHADQRSELPRLLTEALPAGVTALLVVDRGEDTVSLQQAVTSCSWELEVDGVSGEELETRIERFRSSQDVTVTRLRKGIEVQEDVRAPVRHIRLQQSPGPSGPVWCVTAEVAARPRGVRPAELVTALGADLFLARSRRTHQWIERDGERFEPLPWDGVPISSGATVTGQERAS